MNTEVELLKQERTFIAAIRAGDHSAWGGLYDMYGARLYRAILMPRLANTSAAEDALAETFRTAIERITAFEDQGHGIYPWLSRIAHNKAMDMHRASAITGRKLQDLSQVISDSMESVQGADELMQWRDTHMTRRDRMAESLTQLNERYRRAIELRFLEEKSRDQCAAALDVKVATFDVLLLRALTALRKAYADLVPPSSRRPHV